MFAMELFTEIIKCVCSDESVAPFTQAFGCSFSTPIPRLRLSVNLSEAARGSISLRRWYASGCSIRAVLLENWTSLNG